MGQFIKFTFASCLGVIIATFLLVLISISVFSFFASTGQKKVTVAPNSLLKISLDYPIPEKTNNTQAQSFSLDLEDYPGLQNLLDAIELAKDDANIKGILLESSYLATGSATAELLRKAIKDFKTSGKKVWAYADYFGQSGYYLASVADHIFISPIGGMDIRGYAAIIPFFKEFQDRTGIEVKTFYSGQFKSATEPFRRNDISDPNRQQTREFLEGMYSAYLNEVADSRNMEVSKLRSLIDNLSLRSSQDGLEHGLIDVIGHREILTADIKTKFGLSEKDEIPVVKLRDYVTVKRKRKNYSASDRIALVYAEGEIVDNNEDPGVISGKKYAQILRRIRKRSSTKAIVLRVNSPGGSVMASDLIYRELKEAKSDGIPIVVSMGDYAASGGYYIACMADSIVASRNTLTGSIGVFLMTPHIRRFLDEKLGIRFDTVATGPYAAGFTPFMDWSREEEAYLQNMTDRFYDIFLDLVAEGRGMTKEEVHKIAQGRVWTGSKAVDVGLVDKIGNLEDALAMAADLADLDEYRLVEYPTIKDPITRMMEKLMGQKSNTQARIMSTLNREFPELKALTDVINQNGPQARLPFTLAK